MDMLSDRECAVCSEELEGSYEDRFVCAKVGPFDSVVVYLCEECHTVYKQWEED